MTKKLNGQLRIAGGIVVGFDMVAAFTIAEALGVDRLSCAEFLPEIEVVMIKSLNARIKAEQNG